MLRRRRLRFSPGTLTLRTALGSVPQPVSAGAPLESIRGDLDSIDARRLTLYLDHLDAGEDALAWEVLVAAADSGGASLEVWQRLIDAAQELDLDADDEIYGPTVRLATRHLTE